MNVLAKTDEMDRVTWLEARRKGIGGSDVSIIAGINPFKSVLTLWQEKTNQIPIEEFSSEYAYWGSVLEEVVRKEFTIRTGIKVRARKAIMQHPKYEFMLANVDGIINDPEDGMCIFEAKTASEYKKEVWENGVPEEYQLQVQHYMAVTGYQKTYVAALVGGNRFYIYEIKRDEELIELIIQMEQEFWNCVKENRMPEVDGADVTTDWLIEHYQESNGTSVLLDEDTLPWIQQYVKLDQEIKERTKQKQEASNHLKVVLQDAEEGFVGGYQVKWPTVQSNKLDTETLKKEQPDLYQMYLKKNSTRRFSISRKE